MGNLVSRSSAGHDFKGSTPEEVVNKALAANPVMVFSKKFCPYCMKAKVSLKKVMGSTKFAVLELNGRSDGSAIQTILAQMTGASSVPRVFVDGKFIGGGDETEQMAENGKLRELLISKGVIT